MTLINATEKTVLVSNMGTALEKAKAKAEELKKHPSFRLIRVFVLSDIDTIIATESEMEAINKNEELQKGLINPRWISATCLLYDLIRYQGVLIYWIDDQDLSVWEDENSPVYMPDGRD